MTIRYSPARLEALRYAAGYSEWFPNRSMSRALEKADLIVWRFWPKHMPSEPERGWELTEKGWRFLEAWEYWEQCTWISSRQRRELELIRLTQTTTP
jgi:hypothetical protein